MKHAFSYTIKLLTVSLFAILFLFPSITQAKTYPKSASRKYQSTDNRKLGLGVNIGEPIGLNARYYFVDKFSADLIVGYGFGEQGFIIQPSILFNLRDILDYNGYDYSVIPYFGVGVKTGVDLAGAHKDSGIAAMRFPIGVNWVLKRGEFEISAEFAPGVEFAPETEFDATGGLGLRYFFF